MEDAKGRRGACCCVGVGSPQGLYERQGWADGGAAAAVQSSNGEWRAMRSGKETKGEIASRYKALEHPLMGTQVESGTHFVCSRQSGGGASRGSQLAARERNVVRAAPPAMVRKCKHSACSAACLDSTHHSERARAVALMVCLENRARARPPGGQHDHVSALLLSLAATLGIRICHSGQNKRARECIHCSFHSQGNGTGLR